MTLRAEQRELRRQQILAVALELFVRRGYGETKISDIAEAAQMSIGLLFHYFPSKEALLEALVQLGVDGTREPQQQSFTDPLHFFSGFLTMLLQYAAEQPWVSHMFVLMAQVRRSEAMPSKARELALSVDQITLSAQMIRLGQEQGLFRYGDPYALSAAFWCSIQGVMEQHAAMPELPLPEADWLLDIIRRKDI